NPMNPGDKLRLVLKLLQMQIRRKKAFLRNVPRLRLRSGHEQPKDIHVVPVALYKLLKGRDFAIMSLCKEQLAFAPADVFRQLFAFRSKLGLLSEVCRPNARPQLRSQLERQSRVIAPAMMPRASRPSGVGSSG